MMKIYFGLIVILVGLMIATSCKEDVNSPVTKNSISGFVFKSDAEPFTGALVEVITNEQTVLYTQNTDSNGKFSFTNISEKLSDLKVRISSEGYNTIIKATEDFFEGNKSKSLDILMSRLKEDDDCCGTLTVKVVKDGTDNVIEGAEVKLVKKDNVIGIQKTGDNGTVTFTGLCGGDYWVRIYKEGYLVKEDNKSWEGKCDTVDATFGLKVKSDECCNNNAKFTIKDENGKPVNGAKILLRQNGVVKYEATASNNGNASIDGICKGEYSVLIKYEGFVSQEFTMSFECDKTVEKSIVLKKTESLCCNNIAKFTIKDENGKPVNGAKILLRQNGVVKHEVSANDNGFAAIDGICKGEYSVLVKYEGYVSQEFVMSFECEKTVEKSIILKKTETPCCNNNIKFIVKDEQGNVLKGAKVYLRISGVVKYDGTVNDNGYIVIDGICKGEYSILVKLEGYTAQEFVMTVDCAQSLEKIIVLKKNAEKCCNNNITVTVKDSKSGDFITGARLVLRVNGVVKYDGNSKDGKISIDGICEGTYSVLLSKDGYKSIEWSIEFKCGQSLTADKSMVKNEEECCNNQLTFNITNGEGNPLTNVQIKISKGGSLVATLTTQNGTAATNKLLCKGTYAIRLALDGYKVQEYNVTVDCNQVVENNKKLVKNEVCCTAWARVNPFDSESKAALNGAKVRIWKNGELLKTLTVENGFVRFTNLCEGTYGFDISKDGYKGIEWNAEIKCNFENIFEKGMIKE